MYFASQYGSQAVRQALINMQNRRNRLTLVAAGIAALLAVGIWVSRALPIVQLRQQSASLLSLSIGEFIELKGRMPDGLHELTAAGMLRRLPDGKYECAATRQSISQLDDLQVEWQFNPDTCKLVHDELVLLKTGAKCYIIRPKHFLLPGEGGAAMNTSVHIFRALRDHSAQPASASISS